MINTAWLDIIWTADNLKWDPEHYGGTTVFYISQKNIWKPDISLRNGNGETRELGSDFVKVSVFSNGLVIWMPFETFTTSCDIDITYFLSSKMQHQIN